ncbi:hypothetical protein [Flavobacterium sp. J27]|uniref:hypothetical protein n=1 Tax=Flavobacterium sp. J27 TaxID=2060419 RepID=UPI001030D7E0|nr:hypothetical protein [Flavobacterium sp. J27]
MNEGIVTEKVVIYDDTLSVLESIMASIMYTLVIVVVLLMVFVFYSFGINKNTFGMTPAFVTAFFMFLVPAVNISEVNIVEIDFKKSKIFTTQKIVFYKKVKVVNAIEFEYVALNKSNFSYVITIWYKGNRHFTILSFYKKEKALLYARLLCKQMEVDLLDKTSGFSKWIDNSDL